MVRTNSALLRGKAERDGQFEGLQQAHLMIKPALRIRALEIGPTQAGAQLFHS